MLMLVKHDVHNKADDVKTCDNNHAGRDGDPLTSTLIMSLARISLMLYMMWMVQIVPLLMMPMTAMMPMSLMTKVTKRQWRIG